MKKTKGQLNHVFTIIATLLIAGVIIFVGARLITSSMETKCDSDFIRFEDDLLIAINNNNNYGSVTAESFRIPCNAQYLCFVDSQYLGTDISTHIPSEQIGSQAAFIIQNSVKDNVQANIFLVNDQETKSLDFSSNVVSDKPVLCIEPSSGRFSMIMSGQGRKTKISSENDVEQTSEGSNSGDSQSQSFNSGR